MLKKKPHRFRKKRERSYSNEEISLSLLLLVRAVEIWPQLLKRWIAGAIQRKNLYPVDSAVGFPG